MRDHDASGSDVPPSPNDSLTPLVESAPPAPTSDTSHGRLSVVSHTYGSAPIGRRVGSGGERLTEAYNRGARLLIRQSSHIQARNNLGSQDAQRAAKDWLGSYGFNPDRVEEVWALGESGQAWAERPVFYRVLDDARAGRFGILILPLHSRAGRYDADTLELFDAMAKQGGYILVERQLYDPRDHNDLLVLKFFSALAEHQARATALWMSETRLRTAQQLRYRRTLPLPLAWAVPDDSYRGALLTAGMHDVLDGLDARIAFSGPHSEVDGRVWYPLPIPDAAAYSASSLLIDWFLETHSVAEVCRRVYGEVTPGQEAEMEAFARLWPAGRLGTVPRYPYALWLPDQAEKRPVTWGAVSDTVLRGWLRTPALYGIYSFTPGNDKRMSPEDRAARTPAVFVRDAFQGLRPGWEYDRVGELLAHPPRVSKANRAVHAQGVLPKVRCAHPLGDGSVCGHTLSPTAVKGTLRYFNPNCMGRTGHTTEVAGGPLLRHVLGVVAHTVHSDAVGTALAAHRIDGTAARRVMAAAQDDVERLGALLAAAEQAEDQNRTEGKMRAVGRARARQADVQSRLDIAEKRLAKAQAEGEEIGALGDADGRRIAELAGSLPNLLTAASNHPDLLRPILDATVSSIFVRRVALSTFEVDVDFPTGITVRGMLRTAESGLPQAAGAYAHARLAVGVDAAQVSAEIRRARRTKAAVGAERVVGAATEYALAASDLAAAVAPDTAVTLGVLAQVVGETSTTVLGAALGDMLGRAWSSQTMRIPDANASVVGAPDVEAAEPGAADGDALLLAPTESQLHAAFPAFAHRDVARAAGWPEQDCVPVVALRTEMALSYRTLIALVGQDGRSGHRFDAVGRCYARRSDVLGTDVAPLQAALAAAPAATRALAPEYWVPVHEFARRAKMSYRRVQAAVHALDPAALLDVHTLVKRRTTLYVLGDAVI